MVKPPRRSPPLGSVPDLTGRPLRPTAIEPLRDVIDLYQPSISGWLPVAVLLLLVAVPAAAFVHELRLWRSYRRRMATRSGGAS